MKLGFWSLRLLEAYEQGFLTDVQELTTEEMQALLPVYEEEIQSEGAN